MTGVTAIPPVKAPTTAVLTDSMRCTKSNFEEDDGVSDISGLLGGDGDGGDEETLEDPSRAALSACRFSARRPFSRIVEQWVSP